MQWHTTNVPFPKGRSRRIARNNENKTRMKPNRENINLLTFMPSIQDMWYHEFELQSAREVPLLAAFCEQGSLSMIN
jgi:hypothetical protein